MLLYNINSLIQIISTRERERQHSNVWHPFKKKKTIWIVSQQNTRWSSRFGQMLVFSCCIFGSRFASTPRDPGSPNLRAMEPKWTYAFRKWLDTPSVLWEYDWMPIEFILKNAWIYSNIQHTSSSCDEFLCEFFIDCNSGMFMASQYIYASHSWFRLFLDFIRPTAGNRRFSCATINISTVSAPFLGSVHLIFFNALWTSKLEQFFP